MALTTIILFLVGLVILVKGADFFVRSAASIAQKAGVSEFIIGLTLVALGTSIPELATAIFSSIKHESGLIIGNVIGANITNICLITGIAATIAVIKTRKTTLQKDGYILLFTTLVLFAFIFNRSISRVEGIILLVLYLSYILFTFDTKSDTAEKYGWKDFIKYFFKLTAIRRGFNLFRRTSNIPEKEKNKIKKEVLKDLSVMIVSGTAIVLGANYLVNGAVYIANILLIPETLIGASIIALGTTLPEMSVTIAAARKGFGNIALGNIIGSNITNIMLILGIAGTIHPLNVLKETVYYLVPYLVLTSIILLIFVKSDWELRRKEGIILLLLYTLFLAILLILGITS